ncbi:MAG: hypothetical protein Q7U98_11840 [Methylicorpusculum sp.]|uniref:hypothetical protein n=1 Tax=Methylicorpusculum sp. TaxID=2713644 RepID=UPI0027168E1B|nr:hypothetical protein [Methylicorpusculum sp.]MDO8843214.1 hypothetical protein [Methylicorpusculum sp.]MDO8939839.1 hypothetical protein [Methylicorpusculum sp.]MDO9240716.1 hypothetical protein [Methylicorpusculum sp.]MDP2202360.1 hypothetical protein [Methylicorpusculum sp.]
MKTTRLMLLSAAIDAPPNVGTSYLAHLIVFGILFGTLTIMCTHMRFQDRSITIIVAIGLFLVLFIGAGIFTPKEAIENIKDIGK